MKSGILFCGLGNKCIGVGTGKGLSRGAGEGGVAPSTHFLAKLEINHNVNVLLVKTSDQFSLPPEIAPDATVMYYPVHKIFYNAILYAFETFGFRYQYFL